MLGQIAAQLKASGVTYREVRHADFAVHISSPADFARALHYPLGRITKTMLLRTRADQKVVATCGADKKLDLTVLRNVLAMPRLEVARPATLLSLGFAVGAMTPLGGHHDFPALLDGALMQWETILVGAGVAGIEIEIAPRDLARITGATVQDITS